MPLGGSRFPLPATASIAEPDGPRRHIRCTMRLRSFRSLAPALALAAVTALGAAPSAQAKELAGLRVCGPDGCVDRAAALRGEHDFDAGVVRERPARAEPFVRLAVLMREPGGDVVSAWGMHFLPRSGLVRSRDEHGEVLWTLPPAATRAAYRRAARGVRRHPAARLPRDPAPATAEPVEVFMPAATQTAGERGGGDSDGFPVAPALAAGGLAALLLAAARRRRRT